MKKKVKRIAVVLSALLALCVPMSGCGQKLPPLLAITTENVADSIMAISRGVGDAMRAQAITPEQAIAVQEELLRRNQQLSIVPPLLRAIDAGQHVTGDDIDRAIGVLQSVSAFLPGIGIGWSDRPEVHKLVQVVRESQRVLTTTLVELAKVKGAMSS